MKKFLLEGQTKVQLVAIAEKYNIRNYNKLGKRRLVKRLMNLTYKQIKTEIYG